VYNILIQFGMTTVKLLRLIEMCFNETYSDVRRIGKHV
jgi:hypothetical protein